MYISMVIPQSDRSRPDPTWKGPQMIGYHHLKHHHSAVYILHMELAQQMGFKFFQTHSWCVLFFSNILLVFFTKYNASWTIFVDAASHPSNVIQYTSQVGCKINCGSHGSRTLAKVNHRETLGVFASRSRRRNSESYVGLHNTPKEDCRISHLRMRNFVQRLTNPGRCMFPPRPPSNFKRMATQKSTRQEIFMRKTNVDIVVKFHFSENWCRTTQKATWTRSELTLHFASTTC